MESRRQYWISGFMSGQRASAARLLAAAFVLTMLVAQPSPAQTFNVIYNFNLQTGQSPWSGPTMDRAGNLYGTTFNGGSSGNGIAYKLTRVGAGWIFTPLYSFAGGSDGAHPYAGVTIGPDGAIYGATYYGGGSGCGLGCGTVYRLAPPPTTCNSTLCAWNETVLYRFNGSADGALPFAAVAFDQAGNLYGTTLSGAGNGCGGNGCGIVYKLTRSGVNWTESIVHTFTGGTDGSSPRAGITLDSAGNLYGTTTLGGNYGYGVVFQMTPSGGGWNENVLYTFTGGADGGSPLSGVIFDGLGNLYGGNANDGSAPCKAYELSPSGGSWNFTLLYGFTYEQGANCARNLSFDNAGNLYGTTAGGGSYANGVVFELSHSGGSWTYTALHEFTGGDDGEDSYSNIVIDSSGNLYGTASLGGTHGAGVVFQLAP